MQRVIELLFGNEAIAWIQQFFGLGHPWPFRVLSLLGDTWGMIFVAGLTLWLFGRERLYAVAGIIALGAVTKVMLSEIFHQTRPEGPEIVVYEHLDVSSFPSGHVYEAIGPWGLLWVFGCVPLWLAAGVAVGVALGRLYLGTHYLGDVLGGVVFAIPLIWIFARVWRPARAWIGRRSRSFHLTMLAVVLLGAIGWLMLVGGDPRRHEVVGIVAGGAAGLLGLSRGANDVPVGVSRRARITRVVVGLAGIALLVFLDRSAPEDPLVLGTFTAGVATLWALVGAPATFRLLGTVERSPADRRESATPESESV